uniref:Uncharacterized protein n=1 Tax=Cacopsylla melanoneura TaxID=428564 RepID=A0A8D9BMU7_9HEMI
MPHVPRQVFQFTVREIQYLGHCCSMFFVAQLKSYCFQFQAFSQPFRISSSPRRRLPFPVEKLRSVLLTTLCLFSRSQWIYFFIWGVNNTGAFFLFLPRT